MQRREFVGIAGTVAATATGGCLGVLTGSEAVTREAKEARVARATVDETDYSLADAYQQTVNREFEVPGGTRKAKAVNEIAEYHKTVETVLLGSVKAAVFAVLATPAFEFGGKTFNPVGDMSNRELALQIQQQYGGMEIDSKVGSQSVDALGGSLTLSKFEGSGTVGGTETPIYLHVGKVRHGSDFVVPLGVYPQELSGEAETVVTFVGALTHG